jgi:hypothetical protein
VLVEVGVAEQHRTVGPVEDGELGEWIVERRLEAFDQAGHVGRAADAPAAGQDAALVICEEDQGAVETEMADDGLQGPIEKLLQVEGRADRLADLVERRQLGDASLELELEPLEVGGRGQAPATAPARRAPSWARACSTAGPLIAAIAVSSFRSAVR